MDLTIHEPLFNYREIAKQLCLVEDHLFHRAKFCMDCIRKHLLSVEAYAEEAVTLDAEFQYLEAGGKLGELAQLWVSKLEGGTDPSEIAQEVRSVRKHLVAFVYDPQTNAERSKRVASVFLRRYLCDHEIQREATKAEGFLNCTRNIR